MDQLYKMMSKSIIDKELHEKNPGMRRLNDGFDWWYEDLKTKEAKIKRKDPLPHESEF